MKTAGEHKNVRDAGKDINRLSMVICNDCGACAHARDEEQALKDLATTRCAPDCQNCKSLRYSFDGRPAVPVGGSSITTFHICPYDGNRWWQYNTYYHLWKQATSDIEWRVLTRSRY